MDLGRAVITIPWDVVVSVKGVVDLSVIAVDGPGDVVDIGYEAPVGHIVGVAVLGLVFVDSPGSDAAVLPVLVIAVEAVLAVDAVLDVRLEQLFASYEVCFGLARSVLMLFNVFVNSVKKFCIQVFVGSAMSVKSTPPILAMAVSKLFSTSAMALIYEVNLLQSKNVNHIKFG